MVDKYIAQKKSDSSNRAMVSKTRRKLLLTGSALAWGATITGLPGCGGGGSDAGSGGDTSGGVVEPGATIFSGFQTNTLTGPEVRPKNPRTLRYEIRITVANEKVTVDGGFRSGAGPLDSNGKSFTVLVEDYPVFTAGPQCILDDPVKYTGTIEGTEVTGTVFSEGTCSRSDGSSTEITQNGTFSASSTVPPYPDSVLF